jgi:predicted ATPase/DNA-binding SARP family transcriptional activator
MANLTLGLLGSLHIAKADCPITTFESDKARALLAFLAVESDRPHRRDALIGLLWPNSSQVAARHNLRQTLFNLRRAIGDDKAKPPYLRITREDIQFDAASDHSLDVGAFDALLRACETHLHDAAGACADCAARLHRAVELYRGRFLEQFFLKDSDAFEEWALVKRETLHRRALDALTRLANYYTRCGEYDPARAYALRQLELDPWREEAHQQLMRALAQSGERSAALAQYETCRRVLADALGVEPSAETRALYEQIVRGKSSGARGELGAAPPLPAPITVFVGRESEMADLARLIADPMCRLITLVGPGGIGKTRLALQAASNHRAAFAQGAAFVPLVGVGSPTLIAPAIADALGLTFHNTSDLKPRLLNYLREKQILFVLDNLEHLLDGVGLIVEILQHAPKAKLLITSREPLSLQGEWVFQVEGLAIPQNEQADWDTSSAVTLFLQRARQARARFELAPEDRPAIIHICRMVDGTPLAIELAAAWTRTLSCREIAQEIEQSVDFLATRGRDFPERHRSLRAVFDHSWNMLSVEEQQVMRQLSVFRGGFDRQAAEQVTGATLSLLSALVSKSLVRRHPSGRYDLHELVRQYVHTQLQELGEEESVRERHARFFVAVAETADPQLTTTQASFWLNRLDQERDNLNHALNWTLEPTATVSASQRIALGLRLVSTLTNFWFLRGHHQEGLARLRELLARPEAATPTRARMEALTAASYFLWTLGCLTEARAFLEEAAAINKTLGDRKYFALGLEFLGLVAHDQGDRATSRALLEQSLPIWRELKETFRMSAVKSALGDIALSEQDYEKAERLYEESITLGRDADSVFPHPYPLRRLAYLVMRRGDLDRAIALCQESLRLNLDIRDQRAIAACLITFASAARAQGQFARAARLFGAAEEILITIAAPLLPADRDEYERNVNALREQLGAAELTAAWNEGRALTLEQAVDNALDKSSANAGVS